MQVGPKKAAGVLKARGEVNLQTNRGVEVEILYFYVLAAYDRRSKLTQPRIPAINDFGNLVS